MEPERKCVINGKTIEEIYWAGKYICYVDNHLSKLTYEEQVASNTRKEVL